MSEYHKKGSDHDHYCSKREEEDTPGAVFSLLSMPFRELRVRSFARPFLELLRIVS
jgi:hypothetical protein